MFSNLKKLCLIILPSSIGLVFCSKFTFGNKKNTCFKKPKTRAYNNKKKTWKAAILTPSPMSIFQNDTSTPLYFNIATKPIHGDHEQDKPDLDFFTSETNWAKFKSWKFQKYISGSLISVSPGFFLSRSARFMIPELKNRNSFPDIFRTCFAFVFEIISGYFKIGRFCRFFTWKF